ncbi:putative ubiquitin-like-specific protease 2B [Mucuna pruriens]|uniref:Ubiquitin-like-specific protease 2B n=1 Tax=Mucuna pruriens TaxID=157652 RepID=A0A371E2Z2_MUCPR|nr:putative ubiquitin-like-specific protease 2B [Mucuna pruriens]
MDDVSSKFLHMRFISLELPQQENLFDCGLFLLHYVECFLEDSPINFNPFTITKFSNFLKSNWFPPPEASLKRSHIQSLIYDIFENYSLQAPPADCLDKSLPSEDSAIIVKPKVEEDSLRGCCYPALWHGENPSNSTSELETTDIQYPTASPIRVASCLREPGLVFKDLQVADVTSRSDCLQMSPCHQRGLMSPLEEIEESGEEIALSLLEKENSQVGILAYDFPSTSYVSKDHGASETSHHVFSVNSVEAVESHSHSRASWIRLNTATLEKIEESSIPDKTVVEYLSTSGEELADYVVPDSPGANDVDVSVKSPSSFRVNMNSATHQIFDLTQSTSLEDDTLVSKEETLEFESDERDAKRPKLMNAGGPSRRFTRSMIKEACFEERGRERVMEEKTEKVKAEALQIIGAECRSKREMPSLYPHAKGILLALKEKGIDVAIASRSPTADIATAFLNKLSLSSIFVAQEIYSSWTHKTDHFQRIHSRTGVPFNSMLFFDDENRNIQAVSKMGVTSILVGDGVNLGSLREGLTQFSRNWNASQKNKQKWLSKYSNKPATSNPTA